MADKGSIDWKEWRRAVLAGAGAGCATAFVTCPMDVVKTRLQSQSIPKHSNPPNIIIQSILMSANGNGQPSKYAPYKGTVPSLRRIFREEGIKGLYRGLVPTLIGYLPAHAIYFSVYTTSKTVLGARFPDLFKPGSSLNHIFAAMMGGAVAATATNPLWVIRTRLMTQFPGRTAFHYHGTWDAARQIWLKEGFKGMYRGLGPSLLGLIHVAVQFPLYERMKRYLNGQEPTTDKVSLMKNVLVASTVSKVTASLATYPHEVLRTRLQRESRPDHEAKYKGIVQGAKLIWKEEGPFGFYRGLTTTILRVVPASAVTLISFELLVNYMPV